jgi:hypothetical protein
LIPRHHALDATAMIFQCRSCNAAIGELAKSGAQTLFCARCRFKYQVTAGVLASRGSRQITHQRQTTRQVGSYEREYEFRFARPDHQVELVTVRLPGKDDRFRARANDTVAIVYAMRGNLRENLVALINQTTGHVTVVGAPGRDTVAQAGAIGCLTFVVLAYVLAESGVSAPVLVIVAITASIFVFFKLEEALKPRHDLAPAQRAALSRSTKLLQQKAALAHRIAAVNRDREDKAIMRGKLMSPKDKMLDIGSDLYQSRIGRITQALPLIDEQLDLDDQLLAACNKALKMVEIELESDSAAEAIPDDVVQALEEREHEIANIASRTKDVELMLAANEEVERVLRGG